MGTIITEIKELGKALLAANSTQISQLPIEVITFSYALNTSRANTIVLDIHNNEKIRSLLSYDKALTKHEINNFIDNGKIKLCNINLLKKYENN
jgi:hypothetical protein